MHKLWGEKWCSASDGCSWDHHPRVLSTRELRSQIHGRWPDARMTRVAGHLWGENGTQLVWLTNNLRPAEPLSSDLWDAKPILTRQSDLLLEWFTDRDHPVVQLKVLTGRWFLFNIFRWTNILKGFKASNSKQDVCKDDCFGVNNPSSAF